jgi:endonuclease/exonuclease/phosphatase family metal-dependent hydrolase
VRVRALVVLYVFLAACDPCLEESGECVGAPDADTTRSFSVATWNIQEYPRTLLSPALVAEIIEGHAWDLIAIQEINNTVAFAQLVASLPDYEGVLSQEQGPFLRNAILYRPDRVRLENVAPIFPDDSYAFPRDPLAADVTFFGATPASDYRFRFVVLHLKALRGEEDRLRRLDAMTKLHTWAVESDAIGEGHIIFAGDFNDELTDAPSDNIYGPFLSDEYRVLSGSLSPSSYVPFRPLIDHIIVTDDVDAEFQTNTVVINGREEVIDYDRNVSDHLPVEARFTFQR